MLFFGSSAFVSNFSQFLQRQSDRLAQYLSFEHNLKKLCRPNDFMRLFLWFEQNRCFHIKNRESADRDLFFIVQLDDI